MMDFDFKNYNRQQIRFTKIGNEQYVSISDILNAARIQKPSDVATINVIIADNNGFYPIEIVPVAKAANIVSGIKPQLIGLIEFLQAQIISESRKAA